MLTVQEAMAQVYTRVRPTANTTCEIASLSDEFLREPLHADRPYPPFHRVAMDGIAIFLSAWQSGQRSFAIEGCQKAGAPQLTLQDPQACLEVMTGAPLPVNCDAVIRYEDVQINAGVAKIIADLKLTNNYHVHPQGADYSQGDCLLPAGTRMDSAAWTIAASIGKATVSVAKRPRIAIVSTGDELVPVTQTPLPYQIRSSNPYALKSMLQDWNYNDVSQFHLRDEPDAMLSALATIIADHEIIILSGGVSMGKFDFVPQALADLKVEKVFHKIAQKPGKPLWFGVAPENQLVFGLPGNPVSAVVCLRRYVLPALEYSLQGEVAKAGGIRAELAADYQFSKDLTCFLPVRIEFSSAGRLVAHPLQNNGSGDFAALAGSQGIVELPREQQKFSAGEVLQFFPWRRWQ